MFFSVQLKNHRIIESYIQVNRFFFFQQNKIKKKPKHLGPVILFSLLLSRKCLGGDTAALDISISLQ